ADPPGGRRRESAPGRRLARRNGAAARAADSGHGPPATLEGARMTLQYTRLGESGLEVSPLCIGTMMFGDRTDANEARRIVDDARAAGINFIDTADVYANGKSEEIVGAAIGGSRRHWILATKVGDPLTGKPHHGGLSRRWVLTACEDSLSRLKTDYIDIYYLHKD